MKNSIIIIVFLFAFTGMASAQETKSTTNKTACCVMDKKTAYKDTKKTCDMGNPTCCLIAEAEKTKCCADHKAKALSSKGDKESCKTNSACCGDCKKSKTKA